MDPNLLVLFGLSLDVAGAVLLGIESLGAPEYIKELDSSESEARQRRVQIASVSLVNRAFVYILFSAFSFLLLWLALGLEVVAALLLCPFVFFAWKATVGVAEGLQRLVSKLKPNQLISNSKDMPLALLLRFLLAIPWAIIVLIVSFIAILLRFGLDLPLRFVAEKGIHPLVEKGLRSVAKAVEERPRWHLRRYGFHGFLLLFIGFLYQIIGILIQVLDAQSKISL